MSDTPANDGGPAFPVPETHGQQFDSARGEWEQGYQFPQNGMSLRDYFAGQALSMVEPRTGIGNVIAKLNPDYAASIAEDCYTVADAMIKEREK